MNRRGDTEHRRDLLSSLHDRVIEIGAGDGSALYPATVTEVLGVEPDDYLRALASDRAASAPVPGTLVIILVLCSIIDQSAAPGRRTRGGCPCCRCRRLPPEEGHA